MASNAKTIAELLNGDVTVTATDIADDAVTAAKIATGAVVADGLGTGAVTNAKLGTGAITTAKIANTVNLGKRNLIINGAMQVAQRGTSFTGVEAPAYHLDRWRSHISGVSTKGICTITQDSDVPNGFAKSLKVAVTTADTSLDAWAEYAIQQRLEGQDLQRLCKGTSSTKEVTISFWVKSSLTGTYILEMMDDDNSSRHINASYTINTSNTWEHKSITFAGDTAGVFDNDNAKSMTLSWFLAGGSNFQGGSLQTSWGGLVQTKRQVGQVNFFANNGNTFQLTACQMEVGDTATEFEHRSYAEELTSCQRYYERMSFTSNQYTSIICYNESTNDARGSLQYQVTKRAAPTISATSNAFAAISTGSTGTGVSLTSDSQTVVTARIKLINSNSTLVDGGASHIQAKVDAQISMDAEL